MARTGHKSKDTAKALYLKGIPQERIIEMTGIARQTLSRWISQEGWRELKACYGMTREEVTQKILSIINDAIEDPDEYLKKKKIADDLVKLAATIEKMDRSTNVVHYVEAFIRFEDWLMEHRKDYPELPDKVVAMLHGLHDDFLTPFSQRSHDGTGKEGRVQTLAAAERTAGQDHIGGPHGIPPGEETQHRAGAQGLRLFLPALPQALLRMSQCQVPERCGPVYVQ